MSIKRITVDKLRQMKDSEGLILQGCGGNLDEWVDGINDMLIEEGILLEGSKFKNCAAFEHDGLTCLLFPFSEDVKMNAGRLAMWRLQTHQDFGGTWLSDYVPNRLGGFIDIAQEVQKPDCPLIGQDGNISTLWALPPEHCGKTAWRNRQRRCAAASIPPAVMTRRWVSLANM